MTAIQFPIVILAGGLATRLRPLTEKIPKALIDINGEPFIAHQLRLLRKNGIERVVICAGYLGEMIENEIGDGARFGLHVSYSFDGEKLLGTAGALKKALPLLDENFFVIYGDSFLPCDYHKVREAFLRQKKLALMTVFKNAGLWDKSNVEFSDHAIKTYDKKNLTPNMHHIDYGLGVFHREALQTILANQDCDLADLYRDLLRQNQLAAYEVGERFYEVGSFAGIEELKNYLQPNKGEKTMEFIQQFLKESTAIIEQIDHKQIQRAVELLAKTRENLGRLFILGVGGSAANASHAVNDFRKIVGIEAYAPTDNVSELTARTNDEGWATIFTKWLETSRLNSRDALLVLSVGGGNLEKNVSPNLVTALQYAQKIGAKILGIVGRDGGFTAKVADACVIIPTVNAQNVTPHTEAFQAIIWHLLVSHPQLKIAETKWESVR